MVTKFKNKSANIFESIKNFFKFLFGKEDNDAILSPSKIAWLNFRKIKLALIGVGIFILMLTLIYVVTLFYPPLLDIGTLKSKMGPSVDHWFGTDFMGRDYFHVVLEGGKVSLRVGLLATVVSIVIGILIGSVSGYYGGIVDNILMRFAEIVRSFPFLAFAVTFAGILIARDIPEATRLNWIMVILGGLGWTGLARMIRGQILSIREQEFMVAAKALGIKDRNQIMKHIIPNVVSIIIVAATLNFAAYILAESTLSYLGFGAVETPSWGGLIKKVSGNTILMRKYWWLWVFPGMFILSTVLSINLIGDGLRDALDPKSNNR